MSATYLLLENYVIESKTIKEQLKTSLRAELLSSRSFCGGRG